MNCYKEMYLRVFNRMTDLIGEMQAIQCEAEEMFLSFEETDDTQSESL